MAGTSVSPELNALYLRVSTLVKALPCEACGQSGPCDFAHVEGVAGKATRHPSGYVARQPLRPRQGLGILYGLPLCKACHQDGPESFHNLGQEAFAAYHFGSQERLLYAATRHTLEALARLSLEDRA